MKCNLSLQSCASRRLFAPVMPDANPKCDYSLWHKCVHLMQPGIQSTGTSNN
jgi:hypothetical protein